MFAKMLNYIFLCTPPVVAHRNRIDYLFEVLQSETLERIKNNNNKVRKIFLWKKEKVEKLDRTINGIIKKRMISGKKINDAGWISDQ